MDLPLLDRLRSRPLLGDGAIGTLLHQRGLAHSGWCDELNLSRPDLVRAVHADYLAAGAELLETNTFQANEVARARHRSHTDLEQINRRGVELAREVADDRAYVVAAVGPIGDSSPPSMTESERVRCYRAQLASLVAAEPDGIVLETFLDPDELLLALRVTRELTSMPIIAQLTLPASTGRVLIERFRQLQQEGADVVGLNCCQGPASVLHALEPVCSGMEKSFLLSAFPSAGLPESAGRSQPLSTPDTFARAIVQLSQLGVRLLGGCCGTTPAHIRAAAIALAAPERPLPRNS